MIVSDTTIKQNIADDQIIYNFTSYYLVNSRKNILETQQSQRTQHVHAYRLRSFRIYQYHQCDETGTVLNSTDTLCVNILQHPGVTGWSPKSSQTVSKPKQYATDE